MTIKEALRHNLVVQHWDSRTGNFSRDKWRLVLGQRNSSLLQSSECFTTEQTERLVNFREKVRNGFKR